MAISVSERAYGVQGAALSGPDGGPTVTLDFAVDGALGHAIAERAFHHYIPATRYIFGGSAGPFCRIPLDWGANVPLYFLGHTWAKKPKVVVICPSRKLARPHFVQFGRAIAEAAEASGSRVVLVASADHAHAHRDTGPYGFHPAAAEFDNQMVEAVKAEDLMRLLHTDDTLIKNAAPDSLWQMLILGGALEVTPMRAEFLSYEVPQYYGCICAAYTPTNGS